MKILPQYLNDQKSLFNISAAGVWRTFYSLGSALALALSLASASAQFDDFNDGNDTVAPGPWFHYDPIGGLTAPPAEYQFKNGAYRIYAPVPLAPDAGTARAGAFLTNAIYSDFYVSVDVLDFDDTVRQAFGIAARVSTPGLGTTTGYLFSWEPGGGIIPGVSNGDLDISPLTGEQPTGQIEIGSSGLHLERGKSYRFVFMGKGFDFEGQVYELPDTTNALIRLPARDPNSLYPSGTVGLVVADQGDAPDNPGDATFDNFLAADHDPRSICDGFADGNDTTPPPAWFHYDPLGGLTAEPAGFTPKNGGFRIYAPVPMAPDAGVARAGMILTNSSLFDFYVSADVIDFDDTVRQAFGIVARANTPGLGTTTGYLFSWEPGGGVIPGSSNGDLDISPLDGEQPTGQIETAPSGLHLERGKSYRFVFMGRGFDFEGQVYELPDVTTPLIRLPATDPNKLYARGMVGFIAADQGSGELNPGDVTFDRFVATSVEPKITLTRSGGTLNLTWPVFTSYKLESSSDLSSWAEVTDGISQVGPTSVYAAPLATGTRFYRLKCPCN